MRRADGPRTHPLGQQRHLSVRGRRSDEPHACTASTNRSPVSSRCGISPTARWPGANSPPTWCRPRWAGTSCRTPSFVTGRPVPACCSCGSTSPVTRRCRMPSRRPGPDLVDLCPAGQAAAGLPAGAAGLRLRRRRGHPDARRRHPAAADGGVRRAGQQRRPQGRPRPARRRRPRVRRRPRACACTSRTNCAPCCGAGPASRSTTRRWTTVAALADALGGPLGDELAEHITGPRSRRCASARAPCWTSGDARPGPAQADSLAGVLS